MTTVELYHLSTDNFTTTAASNNINSDLFPPCLQSILNTTLVYFDIQYTVYSALHVHYNYTSIRQSTAGVLLLINVCIIYSTSNAKL